MENNMRKKIFSLLTIVWMIIIFYMSNQPAQISTQQSNGAINILSSIPIVGNIIDILVLNGTATVIIRKTAHMFLYAVMSILSFISMYDINRNSKKIYIKSIVISFLYACTDEFHQLFIPGRSCEFKDVLIDTTGAIIAICIIYFILNKKIRTNNK